MADLLARACEEVSTSAVEGTRFLFTTAEMLRVSREIEQASIVSPRFPLYVGVQHGHRLDAQRDVYQTLVGAGVDVIAFGMGGAPSVADVDWVEVPDDPYALTASWFLVRGGDAPHALVGFELDSHDARRRWEGFETRDARLIAGIIDHLEATSRQAADPAEGRGAERR